MQREDYSLLFQLSDLNLLAITIYLSLTNLTQSLTLYTSKMTNVVWKKVQIYMHRKVEIMRMNTELLFSY